MGKTLKFLATIALGMLIGAYVLLDQLVRVKAFRDAATEVVKKKTEKLLFPEDAKPKRHLKLVERS